MEDIKGTVRWPVPGKAMGPLVKLGAKYRLTYRIGRQVKPREAVMVLIGINTSRGKVTTVWSARPVAGTQELPAEAVLSLKAVDAKTEPYLNKVTK